MKPSIGRVVLVHGRNQNGSLVHPAIITRVWNDDSINVMMLPDAGSAYALTSVKFVQDNEQAEKEGNYINPIACWPPRVEVEATSEDDGLDDEDPPIPPGKPVVKPVVHGKPTK